MPTSACSRALPAVPYLQSLRQGKDELHAGTRGLSFTVSTLALAGLR